MPMRNKYWDAGVAGIRPRPAEASDPPLRALADGHGFRPLVALFPFFRDFDRYPYVPLHAEVAGEARRHALDLVDLFPAFASASRETTDLCAPCCEIHPNERGHDIAATAILDFLWNPEFGLLTGAAQDQ